MKLIFCNRLCFHVQAAADDVTTQPKQGRQGRKMKVYLFYFSMMLIHFFKVKIFKDREDGSFVGSGVAS
jgi:hypothetical protein